MADIDKRNPLFLFLMASMRHFWSIFHQLSLLPGPYIHLLLHSLFVSSFGLLLPRKPTIAFSTCGTSSKNAEKFRMTTSLYKRAFPRMKEPEGYLLAIRMATHFHYIFNVRYTPAVFRRRRTCLICSMCWPNGFRRLRYLPSILMQICILLLIWSHLPLLGTFPVHYLVRMAFS